MKALLMVPTEQVLTHPPSPLPSHRAPRGTHPYTRCPLHKQKNQGLDRLGHLQNTSALPLLPRLLLLGVNASLTKLKI